jgi:hypothetical protein
MDETVFIQTPLFRCDCGKREGSRGYREWEHQRTAYDTTQQNKKHTPQSGRLSSLSVCHKL